MADDISGPNAAQAEGWNNAVGTSWATFHEQIDRQIAPLGHAAMAKAGLKPGQSVLDVGCGCGETSIALARAVSPGGRVLAADISELLLGIARDQAKAAGAANLEFMRADAQAHAFPAGAFDAAFSRFGVMFFEDPTAAFANIRRAIKPGGRLAFVCWRAPQENPYLSAAMGAVRDLLPPGPPPVPHAPGPFGLADGERTRGILADAGFSDVAVEALDQDIGDVGLDASVAQALRMGPLGSALREMDADEATRARVAAAVREAYRAYANANGIVRLPAAVWIVSATA